MSGDPRTAVPALWRRQATTRAHARRSQTKRELTEEWSRWRDGRGSPDFIERKIGCRVVDGNERLEQRNRARCADHVDLRGEQLQVCFLFSRVSSIDDVTEGTWVRSIECLCNCAADGTLLGVIHDHGCPCDGLKRQPLQTDCATERENSDRASNPTNHACETSDATSARQ